MCEDVSRIVNCHDVIQGVLRCSSMCEEWPDIRCDRDWKNMHDAWCRFEELGSLIFARISQKTIPNSLRIYKVALALGDYLKVRAHACIGGPTLKTCFVMFCMHYWPDMQMMQYMRMFGHCGCLQQKTQVWTVWESNCNISTRQRDDATWCAKPANHIAGHIHCDSVTQARHIHSGGQGQAPWWATPCRGHARTSLVWKRFVPSPSTVHRWETFRRMPDVVGGAAHCWCKKSASWR